MEKGKHREAFKLVQEVEKTAMQIGADDILLRALTIKGKLKQKKGDHEEALKIYSLNITNIEEIRSKYPEDKFYQPIFQINFNCIFELGNICNEMGFFVEAENCFTENLLICQRFSQLDPKEVSYQFDIALAFNNLGNSFSGMGRFEKAIKMYEDAAEIYNKLLQTDIENVKYLFNLATTFSNIGNLLFRMGRFEEAEQKLNKALENYKKPLQKYPKKAMYQLEFGGTLSNLGNTLSRMGRFEKAKQMYEDASEIYEKLLQADAKNEKYQLYLAKTFNNLGAMFYELGRFEEAKQKLEKALKIREKLLQEDTKNEEYQSDVATALNNLGAMFSGMGHNKEAKQKYEKALEIREELFQNDPKNTLYQSDLGITLNNLGKTLSEMEHNEEAKQSYAKALRIYTEPLQYLSIKTKINTILGLIHLNSDCAKAEKNLLNKMLFLKEVVSTCKEYKDFLVVNGMKYEMKLVMEFGLQAYIEYSILDMGENTKKTKDYGNIITAIKDLEEIEDDDDIKILFASSLEYLIGKKYVNEYIVSGKSNLELIKQAKEHFKVAKTNYEKANVCYCIYSGILEIESIDNIEKEADSKIEIITKVIRELSDQIDSDAIVFFKEIVSILGNRNFKDKDEKVSKLNDLVLEIDHYALRQIFDKTGKKLLDKLDKYQTDPFRPNVVYRNFKLIITFVDPEKVKGTLTIKVGGKRIFNDLLRNKKVLPLDHIPKSKMEEITFEISGSKEIVSRSVDCCEYIHRKGEPDLEVYVLEHDCRENFSINGNNLDVAIVQLKYEIVKDGRVIKLTIDDTIKKEKYREKIQYILDAVKERAKIVVFPEFSIPFEFLPDIQKYANENQIIVIAGSHYVIQENLDKYKDIFAYEIVSKDLCKNICPIIIPSSKIVHTEKLLPAKIERAFLNEEGMTQGDLKYILKISDKLNLGVLVCFEYLDKLRELFVETCDILLVPQANPKTDRFYQLAMSDISNPYYSGNKTFVMANGIFPFKDKISGGSSGLLSTLDMDSYEKLLEKTIRKPIGTNEQFVLFASINTEFNTSRDTSQGQLSIISQWVPIIEEMEILERARVMMEVTTLTFRENLVVDTEQKDQIEKINKKIEAEAREFIKLIDFIIDAERCDAAKLEALNKNSLLIKKYSPLMYGENVRDPRGLFPDKIIKKCCPIFIPNNWQCTEKAEESKISNELYE